MINNDLVTINFIGIRNGEGTYTVSAQGKSWTVHQDQKGNLSVNSKLKGPALAEAQRAMELVKQQQENISKQALENLKQNQVNQQLANRKVHPFIPAKDLFLKATKLDNSTLSTLEQTIDDYMELCIPSVGLEQLKELSEKLSTLSQERKTSIERKFWFIGRFFHKFSQWRQGGGFRTLAERADALRVKMDGLVPAQEQRVEQFKRDLLKSKLEEISKGTEEGQKFQKKTIETINKMDKKEFEEAMAVFFSEDKFVSANRIYRELNAEKRKMFDNLLLADTYWYARASSHFSKNSLNPLGNVWEIDGFDKERYMARFLGEYKAIFATEIKSLIPSYFQYQITQYIIESITDQTNMDQTVPNLEDFARRGKLNELPSYASNKFVQHMFREAVIKYVKEENWAKVIDMLDALNLENRVNWKIARTGFLVQMEQKIMETAINAILNEESLSKEVIEALKENVDYKAYHLFPEKAAEVAAQ